MKEGENENLRRRGTDLCIVLRKASTRMDKCWPFYFGFVSKPL